MASRLVQAHTTAFGSSASRAPRRASPGAAQRRSDGRAARVLTAPRLREMAPGPRGRAAAAADDDVPELPDYDVVTLGPLETSALALSLRGWTGGSDDANAYVAAVDRGYVLLGAHAPSELALAKEYERYWRLSDAAQLPGVRAPQVYAIVEVGGDCSVADALQAHGIAAAGAEPDLFCLRAATAGSDLDAAALASSVAAAVELGACPAVLAVDGFDAPSLTRFVKALNALAPNARVAFNRVAFSVADAAAERRGVIRACADLGVGVVAADPLGEGDSVTDARSEAHDAGMAQLLTFLGAMVGGGVQRSAAQVGLNWVLSKGATPEVATRAATRAWECGGAMLWRLDENAVGIVDERAAAAAQGGDLGAGGKAVGA